MPEQSMALSVAEAATLIGLSKATVRLLVRQGRIAHCREGERILIPRAELESWLAERTTRAYERRNPGGRPRKAPVPEDVSQPA